MMLLVTGSDLSLPASLSLCLSVCLSLSLSHMVSARGRWVRNKELLKNQSQGYHVDTQLPQTLLSPKLPRPGCCLPLTLHTGLAILVICFLSCKQQQAKRGWLGGGHRQSRPTAWNKGGPQGTSNRVVEPAALTSPPPPACSWLNQLRVPGLRKLGLCSIF